MVKLDNEQIQFIDKYLENSDVVHVDIRSEMTDHVASDIEERIKAGDTRDFYFIFKDYMIAHKARLLENNKTFLKAADIKILKALGKTMISWQGLSVGFATLMLFFVLQHNLDYKIVKSWFIGLPIFGFILFALSYFFGLKFLKLDRFSAVERIAFVCNIFFQIFYFIWIISKRQVEDKNKVYILIAVALAMTLLFALVKVTLNMITSYKAKFKNLN
jgi:hypothetical protein